MKSIPRSTMLVLAGASLFACGGGNTGPEPRDEYMRAYLGGTLWESRTGASGDMPDATYYADSQTLWLFGTSYDRHCACHSEIFVSINAIPAAVGTYDVVAYDLSGSLSAHVSYDNGSVQDSNYYSVDGGSVTISTLDLASRVVTGTFSFECIGYRSPDATPIGRLRVTDGAFRMRF